MQNKFNVSVGIPAFNEEANIKNLLKTILSQKGENFVLKEILVFSDGSTDETVERAKEINDARIKILDNKERVGTAAGQNRILEIFSGDVLVLLNADVLPSNDTFIASIIAPFYQEKGIGIVGGIPVPITAENIFEKIINYSVEIKKYIYEKINRGNNIYACHGRVRAFSRDFARKFSWNPEASIAEDPFSYLACIESGYKFFYQPSAQVLYKSPQNFKDHAKQSMRFFHGRNILKKYFDSDLIEQSYFISRALLIRSLFYFFIRNPFLFLGYFCILVFSKLRSYFTETTSAQWSPSRTSKVLYEK